MSQCRKCGLEISFSQREFRGVLKWYPTNPDGSEHWDTCKEAIRGFSLKTMTHTELTRWADNQCRPFWTTPKRGGSYSVSFKKPADWDQKLQPPGELF